MATRLHELEENMLIDREAASPAKTADANARKGGAKDKAKG